MQTGWSGRARWIRQLWLKRRLAAVLVTTLCAILRVSDNPHGVETRLYAVRIQVLALASSINVLYLVKLSLIVCFLPVRSIENGSNANSRRFCFIVVGLTADI